MVDSANTQQIEDLLAHLNPVQRQATTLLDGPLLILAGAGSGKTRVLTHRVAHLILSGKAHLEEILCVTFTNKAAHEMEHRIYDLLRKSSGGYVQKMWVSTFHSLCARLLREHIELLEYQPFFNIYDTADQLSMVKKVMQNLGINEKQMSPKSVASQINHYKMLGQSPGDFNKGKYSIDPETLKIYTHYEEQMKKANSLDFGDLLLKTYELFRMYPDLLALYQKKFKYIMVDEYQDTNHIQYLLVKMLAGEHHNLCVVGDEDQSIYSWRGADISNILNFEKDFPRARIVKLEENYRSSKNIVDAATYLIRNNTERKDKTLFTENAPGAPIVIRQEANEYDEARFVAARIYQLVSEGYGSWQDYAIFYRTNAQSRVLEEQLRLKSIPHKIVGGMRFYERFEIKDMLSYMKLSINPPDDIALKRIINSPTRGIGKTTLEKLEELSQEYKLSLFESIGRAINERKFNPGTTSKLRSFYDLISKLSQMVKSEKPSAFYLHLLHETQYVQRLKLENNPEAESRIQNLEELDNAIIAFEKERGTDATMRDFLEEMALVSDSDDLKNEQDSVTLMTLHVSKGLEYPTVFIVGMEESLFPSIKPFSHDADSELEEERRLAYVGMTRARERLFLTCALSRRIWGNEQSQEPSRFISELPKNLLQMEMAFNKRPSFMRGSVSEMSPGTQYGSMQKKQGFYSKDASFEKQSFPDYDGDDFSSGPKASKYTKGTRVRHPTFGAGSVLEVEGSGDSEKVSVVFSDRSVKKFITRYARLERI